MVGWRLPGVHMLLAMLFACSGGEAGCKGDWFEDLDQDGFGGAAAEACAPGAVAADGDCDDSDPSVFPGATERCNGVDDDCDGGDDEGGDDGLWYADGDGDGWGDPDDAVEACVTLEARVDRTGDCDDTDAAVHPDAVETCDEVDQDCDGKVDEDATDAFDTWEDLDHDGYGTGEPVADCNVRRGWATVDGDCDDDARATHPGADERCNGEDEDCDGVVDEDAVDTATWYADDDGDGYGDAARSEDTCPGPEGWVLDGTDCDDTDRWVSDERWWFRDRDADGYGAGGDTESCDPPSSSYAYVDNELDCDDYDPAINPAAAEIPGDREDNDCDGDWDCWRDGDGDGYGGATIEPSSDSSCADGAESDTSDDCDDADATVNPGADEVPYDAVDQDCDTADLVDVDGDGSVAVEAGGDDCDDRDGTIHPGAAEACDVDGIDEDCDGLVNADDPDLGVDVATWYADGDGDGWGDDGVVTVSACRPADGVADPGDCDDGDPDVHPYADEACEATVDANCDGSVGPTADADADGVAACDDCDDADAAVGPDSPETDLDRVDNDCDGLVDEYVGDLSFTDETELAAFCAAWASVEGSVDLADLDNLRGLACLRAVSGDLRVSDVRASDLDGLELLIWVGGDLMLGGWQDEARLLAPSGFTSLDGLDRLRRVDGDLWVAENGVTDLAGVPLLDVVGESLVLWDLPLVTAELPLRVLGADLWLESLPYLTAVDAPVLESHGGSLWLESLASGSGSFSLTWTVPVGGRLGLVGLPDGVASGWTLPDTVGALAVIETDLTTLDGLQDLREIEGDLELTDNAALVDVTALDDLQTVGGDMSVAVAAADWDGFPALTSVGGWVRLSGSPASLTGFASLASIGTGLELSGSSLTSITGFASLTRCPSLTLNGLANASVLTGLEPVPFDQDVVVSGLLVYGDLGFLAAVESLSGQLSVTDSPSLTTTAGLEALTSVGTSAELRGNAALVSIAVPALTRVDGSLSLQDLRSLTDIDLGRLETVGGDVALEELDALPSLAGLDALTEVGGLWVSQLDTIVDLQGLGALQRVEGSLILERLSALTTTAGVEALEEVGEDLQVLSCSAVVTLEGFSAVRSVGRDLTLDDDDALVRPDGFGALDTIGRDLWVENNLLLEDLDGLAVTGLGNTLWLARNPALSSLAGLDRLTEVPGNLVIWSADLLNDLGALAGVSRVGGDLRITSCSALVDLTGLDGLVEVGENLELGYQNSWSHGEGNAVLVSLDGLGALSAVGGDLWIDSNPLLVDILALEAVQTVGGDLGVVRNVSLLTADAEALADGTPTVGGRVSISGNL